MNKDEIQIIENRVNYIIQVIIDNFPSFSKGLEKDGIPGDVLTEKVENVFSTPSAINKLIGVFEAQGYPINCINCKEVFQEWKKHHTVMCD